MPSIINLIVTSFLDDTEHMFFIRGLYRVKKVHLEIYEAELQIRRWRWGEI